MNLTYTINFEPILIWYLYGVLTTVPLITYYVIKTYTGVRMWEMYRDCILLSLLSWLLPLLVLIKFLLDTCERKRDEARKHKEYKKFYILNTLLFWFRSDSAMSNFIYVSDKMQLNRHIDTRSNRLDMNKVDYKDIIIIDRLCGKDKMIDEDLLDEDFFNKNKFEYWVWENVDDALSYVRKRSIARFRRRYSNKCFYFSFSRLFGEIRVKRAIKRAKTDKERKYYERMLED